ncbi:MAG: hypothetical protein ACRDNS_29560 [Trebonia sp.]
MTMFPQPSYSLLAKTANYTAEPGDVVLVTAGSTAITVTLPGVATLGPVTVRKVDGTGTGTVTVVTADGSKVDAITGTTGRAVGAASTVSGATLVSDGSNWYTVGS